MLIRSEDMQRCFREKLEWADKIDLATAWATNNAGLRDLRECQGAGHIEIRAIVGLWSNITDPATLRALEEIGSLRIVDESRCFHPKIYIFRRNEEAVAWIGSANFTSGGFGVNEELMFETEDTRSIQEWFENRWERCGELQPDAIDIYEHRRIQNPNPPPRFPQPDQAYQDLDHPYQFLHGIADWNGDWNGYRYALEECNRWWAAQGYPYTVFGEPYSWHNTILELHDVVVRRNLNELHHHDQSRLLGLADIGVGLLGSMMPWHVNVVFGDQHNLENIQNGIIQIINADDGDFPEVAIDVYQEITNIDGIGPGIATRLMALARPDHIISLNGASMDNLAEYFNLPVGVGGIENYGILLDLLHQKDWFQGQPPGNTYEHTIWSMRAALIDCFMYQP